MKLYHRTTREAAQAILAEGFRNGDYQIEGPGGESTGGVEFATPPFDAASLGRAKGEGVLLAIELPGAVAEPWEWHVEEPQVAESVTHPASSSSPLRLEP